MQLYGVYKITIDLDWVDSQNRFPRGGISKIGSHAFNMRGNNFKGDLRGKFCVHRELLIYGRAVRGGGGIR